MTLLQYHSYFQNLATELLQHSKVTPRHLRASRVEFDNGAIEAISAGVKSKIDFSKAVIVSIDYTGSMNLTAPENRRNYKNASIALLIHKKEELSEYDFLETFLIQEILKTMYQDWKKAMNSGVAQYDFVRGFDFSQINYDQVRGGFDNNLIGWVLNFQIHERIGF